MNTISLPGTYVYGTVPSRSVLVYKDSICYQVLNTQEAKSKLYKM